MAEKFELAHSIGKSWRTSHEFEMCIVELVMKGLPKMQGDAAKLSADCTVDIDSNDNKTYDLHLLAEPVKSEMTICPECGSRIYYSSYLKKNICEVCPYEAPLEEIKERETK